MPYQLPWLFVNLPQFGFSRLCCSIILLDGIFQANEDEDGKDNCQSSRTVVDIFSVKFHAQQITGKQIGRGNAHQAVGVGQAVRLFHDVVWNQRAVQGDATSLYQEPTSYKPPNLVKARYYTDTHTLANEANEHRQSPSNGIKEQTRSQREDQPKDTGSNGNIAIDSSNIFVDVILVFHCYSHQVQYKSFNQEISEPDQKHHQQI